MGQRDVGHSVVATGRGVLRLSSSVQWVFGHPLKGVKLILSWNSK
ncbi:hypothetical protein [Lysinibacillus sp. NPDC093688]